MSAAEPVPPPASSRHLTCGQCGTTFSCTGDSDCWCAAEPYRLPMPASDASGDCLCPHCLRAAAAGRESDANPAA